MGAVFCAPLAPPDKRTCRCLAARCFETITLFLLRIPVVCCAGMSLLVMLHVGLRTAGIFQSMFASFGAIPVWSVPQFCGSDARRTSPWMNPLSFNDSWTHRGGLIATPAVLPAFLVACGHSGTTPLVDLLSLHPNVFTVAPNAALEYSVKADSFRRISMLVESRRDDVTFANLAAMNKHQNATHWLVKSPSNACRLGYIFATLPLTRVVGLVRDGRDVMLSLIERYPNADPGGVLCLQRWVNDNEAILLYQNDPRLLIVRYEDLFVGAGYPTLEKILVHYHVEKDCLETMLKNRHTNLHEPGVASAAIATEAHTLLRLAQLKRPFKRSTPRWPTAMTLELKRIFKANERAVALLRHFDYSGTHEW